jgi:hypothetical protein
VIFDTDVLIWFLRGDRRAAELIESEPDREASIISLMELIQGARSRGEIRIIRHFFRENRVRVLPVNESVSHAAASLMEEHAMSTGLQVADALIAATAREAGAAFTTGNVKHFRVIPGLDLRTFKPAAR